MAWILAFGFPGLTPGRAIRTLRGFDTGDHHSTSAAWSKGKLTYARFDCAAWFRYALRATQPTAAPLCTSKF